jgi:hypothetical protein
LVERIDDEIEDGILEPLAGAVAAEDAADLLDQPAGERRHGAAGLRKDRGGKFPKALLEIRCI